MPSLRYTRESSTTPDQNSHDLSNSFQQSCKLSKKDDSSPESKPSPSPSIIAKNDQVSGNPFEDPHHTLTSSDSGYEASSSASPSPNQSLLSSSSQKRKRGKFSRAWNTLRGRKPASTSILRRQATEEEEIERQEEENSQFGNCLVGLMARNHRHRALFTEEHIKDIERTQLSEKLKREELRLAKRNSIF